MNYNTEAIRDLLYTAFNDEELSIFCYDHFREVYSNFAAGQTQTARAQMLVEYCDRKGGFEKLLRLIKRKNPKKYAEFAHRLKAGLLNERLEETLGLYLLDTFDKDQYAKLDQAGETDPDRKTLLHQVFIDLEVKTRGAWQPRVTGRRRSNSPEELDRVDKETRARAEDRVLSAMDCLLHESWPKIVIIGGPGQGKSTLGQYLAQAHRHALIRERESVNNSSRNQANAPEFAPRNPRVPFRIILKYFAQWLSDGQRIDTVEGYLAEQVEKSTSRKVSADEIQDILRARPSLVIFDGLDEVTDPDQLNRVLNRCKEFLDRMLKLEADLQVLGTSRPTGYSGQFDPDQYWHLELQPMSEGKVRDYARRWIAAKIPVEEEQQRVMDTVQECQQEEHTRLLLSTPLQITIVLLIAKDGGRPPSQREALFHEYWGTIFRREKSKGKSFIRTEEPLLFGLHAYLGYLLHRRAAGENVRSLLPTEDFEKAVYEYLREKDSRSAEDVIRKQADQLVSEARDRLVLLVQPDKGVFGFELRSLQEFFAAAYLTQTARDTTQRFDRLRAIARSDHWRNVALFFAGRIVRNFSGEAANILELVCRPIDRELPDRYLRRGAWLALDIAADGAFAANRDLQYGALEYALTVLERGVTAANEQHLQAALRRLSPGDRLDILKPLLEHRIRVLPLSCLIPALNAYGAFVGADRTFASGLEALLSNNHPSYIQAAFKLAFQHKVEPQWMATMLHRYWTIWTEEHGAPTMWSSWQRSREYTTAVISAYSPLDNQVKNLSDRIPPRYRLARNDKNDFPTRLMDEPKTLADQMIVIFQCQTILSVLEYVRHTFVNRHNQRDRMHEIRVLDTEDMYKRRVALLHRFGEVEQQLDRLLARPDLLQPLRERLWAVYWMIHEPAEKEISTMMREIPIWVRNGSMPNTLIDRLDFTWPLLARAMKLIAKGDYESMARLKPYLNASQEIEIEKQVRACVRTFSQKASTCEWLSLQMGLEMSERASLSELVPLAQNLGISLPELLRMYVSFRSPNEQERTSAEIHEFFSAMRIHLAEPSIVQNKVRLVVFDRWALDPETLSEGKELLVTMIDKLAESPYILGDVVILFLKLLTIDQTTLALATRLCPVIGNIEQSKWIALDWMVMQLILEIPPKNLAKLGAFTENEDKIIQRGAIALSARIVNAVLIGPTYPEEREVRWRRFRAVTFSWQLGLSLIHSADSVGKKQGIALLTMSKFPITKSNYRSELIEAIGETQDESEVDTWARFIENFRITRSTQTGWQEFCESILSDPGKYPAPILNAAMERYSGLMRKEKTDIAGDEKALGLPAVAGQEK